jgi:hypothetical protein
MIAPANNDSYSAKRPSKSEYFLSRLNVCSPDHSLPMGSGSGRAVTAGQVAAAIAMHPPSLTSACKYVEKELALQMVDRLLFYKYSNDVPAGRDLYFILLSDIMSKQMLEDPRPMKQILGEIRENRGAMQACCVYAIDDVCRPSLYVNVSDREWVRRIGLSNHMLWRRRWQQRYMRLRDIVQELDDAIVRQAAKRI